MADTGGGFGMIQTEQQEEFADRLGITVEIARALAEQLRPFAGGKDDLFGRFRAFLRKAYENQPGMSYGDFDNDFKKYNKLLTGDAALLLKLFPNSI